MLQRVRRRLVAHCPDLTLVLVDVALGVDVGQRARERGGITEDRGVRLLDGHLPAAARGVPLPELASLEVLFGARGHHAYRHLERLLGPGSRVDGADAHALADRAPSAPLRWRTLRSRATRAFAPIAPADARGPRP